MYYEYYLLYKDSLLLPSMKSADTHLWCTPDRTLLGFIWSYSIWMIVYLSHSTCVPQFQ